MSERRSIRLFEYTPGLRKTFAPAKENYLSGVIPELFSNDGWPIRIDPNGFILPNGLNEVLDYKESSIIVGDSIPECLYMDEKLRIESLLFNMCHGQRTFINASYSGATSIDILNLIVNKIVPLKPKNIFLMSGVYDAMARRGGFYNDSVKSSPILGVNFNNKFHDIMKHRAVFLESVINILGGFGVEVVVGTFGHRCNPEDPYIGEGGLTYDPAPFEMVNSITRSVCEKYAVKIIDFEKIMYPYFDLFYDSYHLTPAGASLMSEELIKSGF
jgi:hypothetical protein